MPFRIQETPCKRLRIELGDELRILRIVIVLFIEMTDEVLKHLSDAFEKHVPQRIIADAAAGTHAYFLIVFDIIQQPDPVIPGQHFVALLQQADPLRPKHPFEQFIDIRKVIIECRLEIFSMISLTVILSKSFFFMNFFRDAAICIFVISEIFSFFISASCLLRLS